MASKVNNLSELYTEEMLSWLSLILSERFGLDFTLIVSNEGMVLSHDTSDQTILFTDQDDQFYVTASRLDCFWWDSVKAGFEYPLEPLIPAPSSLKLPERVVVFNEDGASIHYDILGLIYWALTRLEEVGSNELDAHQRFPATSSHAYKYHYLDRPIIDEWLNILGQVIQRVWLEVKLKQHDFNMYVSHDVDTPSLYAFQPWNNVIRMMAGHLLKRQDIKSFFLAPYIKLTSICSLSRFDPFNTFEWLMDVSEANNTRSAFYFICGRTHRNKDADYEIEHPIMRRLIKRMHERGHEVGLHPSYNTYLKPDLIKQEYSRLRTVCTEEGVEQAAWGGRMHYLRWQQPITMNALADAGLNYDTTLGYADRPGFRCGTCYAYPAFDPVTQSMKSLRIRPLIVMESTLMGKEYMNLGSENILSYILQLKDACKKVGGSFSLLWHNSTLISDEQRHLFVKAIEH